MPHQLRVHKVCKESTPAEMQGEIRAFMEAVFSGKHQTLFTKNTTTHLLFYLRIDNRKAIPQGIRLRREQISARPMSHRWSRT